ncbi:heterokaryon incompatibility protein-domain-containing protein [Halenospora varia]|nr:heterokaryon incompatibility protein-domain-containing protein [Halenospora varia]
MSRSNEARLGLQSKDNLCNSCQNIDFNSIFGTTQTPQRRRNGILISSLDQISSAEKRARCYLCQFFWDTRVLRSPRRYSEGKGYCLHAFSAKGEFGLGLVKSLSDTIILAVIPEEDSKERIFGPLDWKMRDTTPYIFPSTTAQSPHTQLLGRLLSTDIDYDIIRGWIDFCNKYHYKLCTSTQKPSVPGFRVIDCNDRKIVPLPDGCEYVALSYVWGASPPENQIVKDLLLNRVSPAIADAMTVVSRIGFQFLWVDRYCISSDEEDKHTQIQNMDLIYMNATVTIIAVGGDDSQIGLPGVSRDLRQPQPQVTVGQHILVSSLPNPRSVIEKSKWNTRGWTYQEGILPRRRLVFTSQQVYFQCNAMHCVESISVPLELLHTSKKDRFLEQVKFHRAFPMKQGLGKSPMDFWLRVKEFSLRSLSYDSDRLNAILGILRVFEKGKTPVQHLWGIPIFPPQVFIEDGSAVTATKRLCYGLTWTSSMPRKRSYGFPSWSWVGWTPCDSQADDWNGQPWLANPEMLKHPGLDTSTPSQVQISDNFTYDVRVGIEFLNGAVVDWETLDRTEQSFGRLRGVSNRLHICAWTFRLLFQGKGHHWHPAESHPFRYKYSTFEFTQFDKSLSDSPLSQAHQDEERLVIVLGFDNKSNSVLMKIMVTEHIQEEDVYERVGMLYYHFWKPLKISGQDEAFLADVRLERKTIRLR